MRRTPCLKPVGRGPNGEGGRASPWPLPPPGQCAVAGSSAGQPVLIAWLAAAASPACSAKQLQQAARAGTPHFQTAAAACMRGSRTVQMIWMKRTGEAAP